MPAPTMAMNVARSFGLRTRASWNYMRVIFRHVAPWVAGGVAIGAFIHGYVPDDVLVRYAGRDNPLGVLVAVLLGIPLYSNAEGVIPIVQALRAKGLPLGTALTFMMAVTGLSPPESLILRDPEGAFKLADTELPAGEKPENPDALRLHKHGHQPCLLVLPGTPFHVRLPGLARTSLFIHVSTVIDIISIDILPKGDLLSSVVPNAVTLAGERNRPRSVTVDREWQEGSLYRK